MGFICYFNYIKFNIPTSIFACQALKTPPLLILQEFSTWKDKLAGIKSEIILASENDSKIKDK